MCEEYFAQSGGTNEFDWSGYPLPQFDWCTQKLSDSLPFIRTDPVLNHKYGIILEIEKKLKIIIFLMLIYSATN